MATTRNTILYSADTATGNITGPWVELTDSHKGAYIVAKATTRNTGSYSIDIETSPENGTPNDSVDVVTNLVINENHLIKVSDQTTKTFAKYARAVLTHTNADFEGLEIYIQF